MVGIFKQGTATVTTAGTQVKLFGAGPYPQIAYLYARNPNADADIYLGDSTVDAGTGHGILLAQTDATAINQNFVAITAPSKMGMSSESFWVDSTVNAKTVEFCYLEVQ